MEEETIKEFTSLKGLEESNAMALYEAGYHSIEDLDDATVEELAQIDGITLALAESIREQLDDLVEEAEEAEVEEAEVDEAEAEEAEAEEAEVEEAEVEEAEVDEAEVEEAEAEEAEAEEAEAEEAEAEEAEAEEAEAEAGIIEVPTAELALDPETSRLLKVRKRQKQKKPHFVQTDQHKKKKLKDTWRRPRGLHNKKRRYISAKGEMVRVGYGSPAGVKGLHPSGFQEVHLKSIQELDDVDPSTQAIRIARTLGQRKRLEIVKKARSLGLKILNPPYEGGEE